jgi:hypothetical protein
MKRIITIKNQVKIVVIGALANDKTSPLGSWRIALMITQQFL